MTVKIINEVFIGDLMNKKLDQITLVELNTNHAKDFMQWASDEEVVQWMMWDSYNSIEEAESFIRDVVEKHPCFKGVCVGGKVVGSITLDKGKGAHRCKLELGYVIAKKYWGKGIATEAVKKSLIEAFNDSGIERVEAFVDPQNKASQRVLEKAGFLKEGLLRKCIIQKGEVKDRLLYSFVR